MIQQTDVRVIRSIALSLMGGLCLWPVLSLGQSTVAFQTTANTNRVSGAHPSREIKLSPGAAEVARLIGVSPLLEKLQDLSKTEQESAGSILSPESLTLRQEITEAVLGTSLEVDGVIAELDSEMAQSSEIAAFLASRRDRAIGVNALANIVSGGGLGIVGSALQLNENTSKAGSAVGIAAGSVTTALSVIGLRQQHGGHHSLGIAPNMLAKFFDRTPEFHSDYPEEVWNYLNDKPPGESGSETRRQELIRRWTELGRLESLKTANGQQKVDFLTSSVSSHRDLTIDLLADREAMLSDVKATVSLMKRDLGKLLLALRTLTMP